MLLSTVSLSTPQPSAIKETRGKRYGLEKRAVITGYARVASLPKPISLSFHMAGAGKVREDMVKGGDEVAG